MNGRSHHPTVIILLAAVVAIMAAGCVPAQVDHKIPTHTWGGEITGDVIGKMVLQLRLKQADKNTKSAAGSIIIKIDSVKDGHGSGRIDGRLSGEIRDGILSATFSGEAVTTDGHSHVNGTLKGSLTFSSGQGNWRVRAITEAREYQGAWHVVRQ